MGYNWNRNGTGGPFMKRHRRPPTDYFQGCTKTRERPHRRNAQVNKMLMAVAVALALCGGPAYAREGMRLTGIDTAESNTTSASPFVDDEANYANENNKQRGLLMGSPDLRMGTISSTVLYPGAAFTQFTFVFPNNTRKVRLQAHGGSGTNFCHAGWSSSLTGSATNAGTIEAYQHLPRIGGAGGGVQDIALVAQSEQSRYEWTEIQTRGGFSTLYCGCTDTAAIGIDRITAEYYRP